MRSCFSLQFLLNFDSFFSTVYVQYMCVCGVVGWEVVLGGVFFHLSSNSVCILFSIWILSVNTALLQRQPDLIGDGFGAFTFKWKSRDYLMYKCHVYEIHLAINCSHSSQLTVIALIKDDELLPVQLWDKGEQDFIDSNRWTGSQGVALSVWAGVELAGSAGCTVPVSLDEEVGNVHRIRQRLQGTCGCAARGCDQSEDPLIHQLTCWKGERKK